jgi:hypothetical protein
MIAAWAAETPFLPVLTCLCHSSHFQGAAGGGDSDSRPQRLLAATSFLVPNSGLKRHKGTDTFSVGIGCFASAAEKVSGLGGARGTDTFSGAWCCFAPLEIWRVAGNAPEKVSVPWQVVSRAAEKVSVPPTGVDV